MACLHQLFQEQVERTPEAIAVVDGHQQLTYREFDQVTDAMAGYLLAHGVQPDTSVGVMIEKSAEYMIACMAALKAGGAYLPLDMAYPDVLLNKIAHETKSPVIVTKAAYRERLDAAALLNRDVRRHLDRLVELGRSPLLDQANRFVETVQLVTIKSVTSAGSPFAKFAHGVSSLPRYPSIAPSRR